MTDTLARLRAAIHLESAAIAPQTSALIEAAREATIEIERLRKLPNDGVDARDRILADNDWMAKEIERLRAYAKHERSLGAEESMIELQSARQEIERLRAQYEPVTAGQLAFILSDMHIGGMMEAVRLLARGPLYRQRKP